MSYSGIINKHLDTFECLFRLSQKDQIMSNPPTPLVRQIRNCLTPLPPCQKKSENGWLPPPPWWLTSYVNGSLTDPNGSQQTLTDSGKTWWIQTDPNGPWWTQTDPDKPQRTLTGPTLWVESHMVSAATQVSLLMRHGSHIPGQLFSLSLVEAKDGWSRFSLP